MTTGIIDRLFVSHPRSAGQSYFEHLRFAWRFGAGLLSGAFAAFVHGVFPFLLQSYAGDRVRGLYARLGHRVAPGGVTRS